MEKIVKKLNEVAGKQGIEIGIRKRFGEDAYDLISPRFTGYATLSFDVQAWKFTLNTTGTMLTHDQFLEYQKEITEKIELVNELNSILEE